MAAHATLTPSPAVPTPWTAVLAPLPAAVTAAPAVLTPSASSAPVPLAPADDKTIRMWEYGIQAQAKYIAGGR